MSDEIWFANWFLTPSAVNVPFLFKCDKYVSMANRLSPVSNSATTRVHIHVHGVTVL